MLFEEAEKRGLRPRWESGCGLFSFPLGGKSVFVYYAKIHGNSQLGDQICRDKSLARAFLAREGFDNIPFCYSKKKTEINAFFDRHRPIVRKPLLGMRSENVLLIADREQIDWSDLENAFFEQYVEGVEHRYLVLDGEVIGVQKKPLDPRPGHPWHKCVINLEKSAWAGHLVKEALSVARLLRMRFLAVDFIVQNDGRSFVLELNGMPGTYLFQHPHEGKQINVAEALLTSIVEKESADMPA